MSKVELSFLQSLARRIMLEINEEEACQVQSEFQLMFQKMPFLHQIDTEGVEPMVTPISEYRHYLRADEVGEPLTVDEVLQNAQRREGEYFWLPKVVKDEN